MQTKYLNCTYRILVVIFQIFVFVSCEDTYYEDISKITDIKNINAEIIINGGITSEKKLHEITLTKPILLINGQNIDSISGATVFLKIGDDFYEFREELIHPNNIENRRKGTYVSIDSIKGKPGAIHTLIVNYAGKTYTASDSMVATSPINLSSIDLPYRTGSVMIDSSGEFPVLAIKAIKFGTESSSIYNWYSSNPIIKIKEEIVASVYYFSVVDQQGLLSETYGGASYQMYFSKYDRITIKKHSISKKYEDYLIAVLKETSWNSNLFSTTPANVPTNISKGGYGYFHASDIYTQEISLSELLNLVN